MNRRVTFVTSSTREWLRLPDIDAVYRIAPYWFYAVLYHLVRMGWAEQRLGMKESRNPWRLAKFVAEFNPNLIYVHGPTTALQPIIARKRLCRWNGPVVHGWDDYYDEVWAANFGRAAGLFMRLLERQVIRFSDYIITLSYWNKQRAEKWGKRAWYIPNGCDVPQYDPSKCAIRLAGSFNLVYCGDQARYKRVPDLLEAMRRLPKEIKLYLIGERYPYVEQYASDNVIILGRLPDNDKWSVMSQADVLVTTSDQDCNAKFQEYIRMGKPILGYDGRPNLFFTNRRNALLTRDYRSAILELRDSPDLRHALAENVVKDIRVYTWREIAEQFEAVFSEILKEYRSSS